MHLADDHTLCSVDDEGSRRGHQRNFTQVDVLFLDVSDLLNFLFTFFFLPDNQAQSHPNWTGIGHTPNPTLLHSVLGLAQAILDIFQCRRIAVIGNREHRAEDRFEATPFVPLFRGNIAL